ncbi:MAG: GNAT family N-acetyltransferase [Bacteroidaceae bacterium]|nr:GNAT family N-acetyltransferase [Bacteroidaceae bacterium]
MTAIANISLQEECTALWKEVFGDEEEFILSFMQNYYEKSNMLYIEENGKLLSMLHLIPFEFKSLKVGYIYALATATDARGRGFASTLIKKAIEKARSNGFAALVTLPAEEKLHNYYNRFGFKGKYKTLFHTPDNFDFGTGDKEKDFVTVLELSQPSIFADITTPLLLKTKRQA